MCHCCALGREEVVLTDDEELIPDSHITFVDDNAFTNHLPSSIRPKTGGEGVEFEIPDDDQRKPYVEIDLDQPGYETSSVDISDIKLTGNVARVKISIKANDNGDQWVSKKLDVDEDGHVKIPALWRTGEENMVSVGVIRIEPEQTRPTSDSSYIFKVYLYGCPLCK